MSAPPRETVDTAPVDAALAGFFTDGTRHLVGAEHTRLWAALRDASAGGKRLRPMLFHSVYLALGGRQTDVAAQVGAALELLHTALVVHDDVIDGDTVRRGRPNVVGTFAADARGRGHDAERATHYGQSAAILAGDLALAGAVRVIALCGASPATVARMLDLVDRALHLSAAGELTDVRLSLEGDADVPSVITMEHQKTAVYSFELPLQLAAVLAGAHAEHEAALTRFARLLGIVYQIRDDLDGMFGDEAATGKSSVSDLREGKCTPLIAYARTTPAWAQIRPYLASGTADDDDAARVRLLLEECGARAFVEGLAEELTGEAREAVAHLPEAPLLDEWASAVTRGARAA
ncbi:polyprenyl synthetase family protein [Georgenia satyanarayanai]|uniref:polyprenyl synthetase family protein n=1 Tax=Georgenia satyanarayanai TaxID=860221 RepID=UPI00203E8EAD|nr:polyprenyl synthetase family protein [Georgenia satyanarayanai]MCM3662262.1 polyprenyl synthetase family protein [Georgenia satyanarayanai]